MIQAKIFSVHGLLAAVAMGCGKMETGIPWWVIFGAVIIFACLLGVFTAHTPKGEAPVTIDGLGELLTAHNLELKSIRDAAKKLSMEPLGREGATFGSLPAGTNLVRLSDGSFRLALPVRLSANEAIAITDSIQLKIIRGDD